MLGSEFKQPFRIKPFSNNLKVCVYQICDSNEFNSGSNIFDIEWNAEINSKNSMLKGDLASKNAFRVDQVNLEH